MRITRCAKADVIAKTIANESIATWFCFEHMGKVFSTQHRWEVLVDSIGTHHLAHDLCSKSRFLGMVDHRRRRTLELHHRSASMRLCCALRQLTQPCFNGVES